VAFTVTGPDFAAALFEQLQARPGLVGTPVMLTTPPTGIDRLDAVVVIREAFREEMEWAALGRRRQNATGTIPALVRAWRTADAVGSQETMTVYRAAASQAAALLNEVVSQITQDPPGVGDQTIEAHVSDIEWVPVIDMDQNGWFMDCLFNIHYTARVSS
jgi:hypothetical protein